MRTVSTGAVTLTLACGVGCVSAAQIQRFDTAGARVPRYLVAAARIGNWITGLSQDRIWPADALRDDIDGSLADGVAGVTLFLQELHAATGDARYAREARRGADWLLTALPAEMARSSPFPPTTSFYYGAPGMAFVLDRVYKATGDVRYRDGARSVVRWLHSRAEARTDSGWTSYNDILFGYAGTAVFLLYAARELDDPGSRTLAAAAGHVLLGRARPERGGLTWVLREGTSNVLPNFSHGAAGIGFALARLHEETRAPEFWDAAEKSAGYLLTIARQDSGALRIPYGIGRPEWESQYGIDWAHGMAGSARFFGELARVTAQPRWRQYVGASDVAIRQTGIPGERSWRDAPWVQLDRRFGLTGVADFYLDLFSSTRDRSARDAATRIGDHLLTKATVMGDSLYWVAPRLAFMPGAGTPGVLTGYFHGAAGHGLLLLRLDAAARGKRWTLRFPDS